MRTYREILEAKKIHVSGVNGNYDRWTNAKGNQVTQCPVCQKKIIGDDASGKMETHLKSHKTDEMTVAGAGVGAYHPPMAMSKKFSNDAAMRSVFGQCTKQMDRKQMLSQCRKLGLSVGSKSDDELRKILNGMSLRQKRNFIGA